MALSNEQYDALMREYNHKQSRNSRIVSYRTKELYSAVPSLTQLDEEVSKISISSITAIFSGKDIATASAESKKKLEELKMRRINLMKSAGFPEDYLEPPYDCPDCKDTGYINGERCHCFKQAAINIVYKQSNINNILSKENFDAVNYLNNLLSKTKTITNSDLLSFKLKIVQREINSDIDLYSNNVVKSQGALPGDLKLVNGLQNAVKQKIIKTFEKGNSNKKNKKENDNEFNIKIIESNMKDIDKLKEAITSLNK